MKFREDLFYRLNTIIIDLPPLRNRREDIPFLADMFLQELNGYYNKNIKFSAEVYNYLLRHNWPGNIRELRHMVEKGVILAEKNIMEVDDIRHSSSRSDNNNIRSFNLDINEKRIIASALESFDWNISRAAKELGINRSTLYEKIARYEISKD